MTTTDRMSNLDSRREVTDRLGETVILGNSVGSGAVEVPTIIEAAFGGESEATADIEIIAVASMDMDNASFGIWAVDFKYSPIALLRQQGAAIAAGRMLGASLGTLGWDTDGQLLNIQSFTTTAAYTPTTGTTFVVVYCMGGGGGGGGAEATGPGEGAAGGGGGAGALAVGRITSGFSGVTVTVGGGGAGSTGGPNTASTGGTSSFGSFLIASGGLGGAGETAQAAPMAAIGGAGGSSSGSASLFGSQGQKGEQGYAHNVSLVIPGAGGSTIFGAGGFSVATAGSRSNDNGRGYGSGGAGAANGVNQGANRTGGTGGQGIVLVYEYSA